MRESLVVAFALAAVFVMPGAPVSGGLITGVGIDSVSSYYPTLPPQRLVDGSGLNMSNPDPAQWTHTSSDWNASWETDAWNLPPAYVVFDLKKAHEVQSFHVWNFNLVNQYDWTPRSSKDVYISTSLDKASWSDAVHYVLQKAPGVDTYKGELFSVDWSDVRYVKFDIRSNYGDGAHVGLSAVQFSAVPEPSAVIRWLSLGAVGAAAWRWRRRRAA